MQEGAKLKEKQIADGSGTKEGEFMPWIPCDCKVSSVAIQKRFMFAKNGIVMFVNSEAILMTSTSYGVLVQTLYNSSRPIATPFAPFVILIPFRLLNATSLP